jgi:hypothetical protein
MGLHPPFEDIHIMSNLQTEFMDQLRVADDSLDNLLPFLAITPLDDLEILFQSPEDMIRRDFLQLPEMPITESEMRPSAEESLSFSQDTNQINRIEQTTYENLLQIPDLMTLSFAEQPFQINMEPVSNISLPVPPKTALNSARRLRKSRG